MTQLSGTSPAPSESAERPPPDRPAVPIATARRKFSLSTFSSLRHRDFMLLWSGILSTSAGVWMEQVALGWLVYEKTNSPLMLGAITGMRAFPFLFIGPFAGVVADRFDRKRVMLISQYWILAMYIPLVALLITGRDETWHLFAFTISTSIAWSFNQPIRQTLIPQLVPREDLLNAIALQSVAFNATRTLGPALGGYLMATVGGVGTFALVSVAWVGVIITTHMLHVPDHAPTEASVPPRSFLGDLADGLRYIRSNPLVFNILLISLIPMIFGMSYFALMPIFARDVFGMDARGLGELLSMNGLGAVLCSLAVASLSVYRNKGRLVFGSGAALGIALVCFALSTNYLLSLALMGIIGGVSMSYFILTNTTVQLITPPAYMGRVMSIYMLDRGLMPLGSFGVGFIAQWTGAPIALALSGAACALCVLGAWFAMPRLRTLD